MYVGDFFIAQNLPLTS